MMTTETEAEATLGRLCDELEASVGPAIVPGELASWCRQCADTLEEQRPRCREVLDRETASLAAIAREDPELQSRTDELSQRVAAAAKSFDQVTAAAQALCEAAQPQPGTSAEPTQEGEGLRKRVLTWIIEVRALGHEIRTWSQEAVLRDRGVAG